MNQKNIIMISNIFLILVFLPGLRYFGPFYYVFLGTSLILVFQEIIRNQIILSLSYITLSCIYLQQILQLLFIFGNDLYLYPIARISIPLLLIIFFNFKKQNKIRFYNWLFLANLLSIFSILIQFVFPNIFPFPNDDGGTRGLISRFYSLGGNTNILGTSIALFLPFLIYSDNFFKVLDFKFLRIFSIDHLRIVYLLIYSLGVIVTLSRGALVTLIYEFGLIFFLSFIKFNNKNYFFRITIKRKIIRYLFLVFFAAFLVFLIIFALKPSFFNLLLNLFMPIFMMLTLLGFFSPDTFWNYFPYIPLDGARINLVEDFLLTRISWGLESVAVSFKGLLSLLFGIGPSAYGSIVGIEADRYNHNNYFDLAEAQGLLGLFFFAFFLFIVIKKAYLWESNQKKLMIVALSTFLIASLYSSGILHHPLWISPLIMIPSIPIFVKVSSIKG